MLLSQLALLLVKLRLKVLPPFSPTKFLYAVINFWLIMKTLGERRQTHHRANVAVPVTLLVLVPRRSTVCVGKVMVIERLSF